MHQDRLLTSGEVARLFRVDPVTVARWAEAGRIGSIRTLNNSQATSTTLQQLCIQATQKVLEEGGALPAGWNCFGASAATITATGK